MSMGLWKFLDLFAPVALDPNNPLVKDYKQENTTVRFLTPNASNDGSVDLRVGITTYDTAKDQWVVELHPTSSDEDISDAPSAT